MDKEKKEKLDFLIINCLKNKVAQVKLSVKSPVKFLIDAPKSVVFAPPLENAL